MRFIQVLWHHINFSKWCLFRVQVWITETQCFLDCCCCLKARKRELRPLIRSFSLLFQPDRGALFEIPVTVVIKETLDVSAPKPVASYHHVSLWRKPFSLFIILLEPFGASGCKTWWFPVQIGLFSELFHVCQSLWSRTGQRNVVCS